MKKLILLLSLISICFGKESIETLKKNCDAGVSKACETLGYKSLHYKKMDLAIFYFGEACMLKNVGACLMARNISAKEKDTAGVTLYTGSVCRLSPKMCPKVQEELRLYLTSGNKSKH